MTETRDDRGRLVGTWTKTTTAPCADGYPATLTFATGTYRGARESGQGFVAWDAGIYRMEGADTLVMGTATDELVSYRLTLAGDHFDVTDGQGCRVTYRRDPATA